MEYHWRSFFCLVQVWLVRYYNEPVCALTWHRTPLFDIQASSARFHMRMLLSVSSVFAFLPCAVARTFTVYNGCPFTIWCVCAQIHFCMLTRVINQAGSQYLPGFRGPNSQVWYRSLPTWLFLQLFPLILLGASSGWLCDNDPELSLFVPKPTDGRLRLTVRFLSMFRMPGKPGESGKYSSAWLSQCVFWILSRARRDCNFR
jgi:hypothetical protein